MTNDGSNEDTGGQDRDDAMDATRDDMTDDRFDAWVQAAARDYNRPTGIAPRDAMWGEIDRATAGAAATPVVPVAAGASAPVENRPAVAAPVRSITRRASAAWWQMAAAAVILAAGIGIGRGIAGTEGAPASSTATLPAGAADGSAEPQPSVTGPSGAVNGAALPSVASANPSTRPTERTANGRSRPDGASPASESYDLAAVQHLSRAEALLTSFRSPAAGDAGERDAASAAGTNRMDLWARDLLADTRLLLDSPAAADARRRLLLEDLELVLAQIVQLPAESTADRGLVQRSIERGAVLSRLRSSIPAGYTSGT